MEIFLSFLKLIIPVLLISYTSFSLIKFLKINDLIEKFLLLFLFNCFYIVISIEILSFFKLVSLWPLIILYSLSSLACLIAAIVKKHRINISFSYIKLVFKNFYNNISLPKIIKIIIIVWLVVILLTTFFIGITVPPKNYDSMTYHLTRAAFWKQNQTINHYSAGNVRQLENPVNAEVLFLWLMIFTNSDNILFLVQWLSLVILLITFYKLIRYAGLDSGISFFTSFIICTFDMIIFQSSSTQNDLFLASFIVLTLYFIFKTFKDETINVRHSVFAGLLAGFAIGIKGYSYLFIPGFLLFILISLFSGNKNFLKLRLVKSGFIILFSILGCILFASYNWVGNLMDFGNIFSSSQTTNLMSIVNPDSKTFLSNISRHLSSFYQLKDYDRGIISSIIQNILNKTHAVLGLDISSQRTTWPGTEFYLSSLALNMDVAYFGPIVPLLIIPSIFYNLVLFIILKSIKKIYTQIRILFLDSLRIFLIPFVFFSLYIFIFKWQPWAGRLMISYVVLLSIGFAFLILLIKIVNKKYLFNLFIAIILFISIIFSGKVLFNSWDPKIIPVGGESIYSVSYEERRYMNAAPEMYDVYKKANVALSSNAKVGLFTSNDSWDYIFFGKNFTRQICYISENEMKNESFEDIFLKNNLDGLILYRNNLPYKETEEFESRIQNLRYLESNNYYIFYR